MSGKSFNDKRGATINIAKNRPDKFYQNSPERYIKTTGAFTKGQTPQTFILKSTSRSKSKQVVGAFRNIKY